MTNLQKLIHYILNPCDAAFRLIKLLDTPVFHSKILDLRDLALMVPDRYAANLREELAYIETSSLEELIANQFPYPRVRDAGMPIGGYDAVKALPFVEHKGKRLYFPACMSVEEAVSKYRYYRDIEGITGEGCLSKSPHCYQTADFRVEEGDVVLDIGSAEALFALDSIEKASAVFVFEYDPQWLDPLRATFAPYADKVKLFTKFVGGKTEGNMIALHDAVHDIGEHTYFIKMDIEGAERAVIDSSCEFLKDNHVKMACCVYHRQDDEQYICSRLKEYGYEYTLSDGYMLTSLNGIHAPFFRHVIAYATNMS